MKRFGLPSGSTNQNSMHDYGGECNRGDMGFQTSLLSLIIFTKLSYKFVGYLLIWLHLDILLNLIWQEKYTVHGWLVYTQHTTYQKPLYIIEMKNYLQSVFIET